MSPDRPPLPEPVDFLGCPLRPITTRVFMETLAEAAERRDAPPLRVSYLNAHASNLFSENPAYREAMRDADLVYADGQSVVWASRLLGRGVPERVNAGDFIGAFCKMCAARGLSLYLLGSAEGVAESAAQAWSAGTPGLRIAGTRHGHFSPDEEPAAAAAIRAAAPNVLLIGMSAPRQETFMQRRAEETGAPVVWCVGALFEYFGAGRARAPRWMRRTGLEWLFRLALEPRRLWRRYLLGNVRFIARVLRARRQP